MSGGEAVPQDWAIEQALAPFLEQHNSSWTVDLIKSRHINPMGEAGFTSTILAFARHIEKYEKPPVDPDVLVVRKILDAFLNGPQVGHGEIYKGGWDSSPQFIAALAVLRAESGK